ncbi:MAG: phosphatidylglycerol lysyltransferase domain-containing protein [Patescibacteria group bacterium]
MSIATHNLKTIPVFPHFVPINLSHKTVIDGLNNIYTEPNSDLNFVSLWGYMHVGCEISRLGKNLIYKLLDYHSQKPYYSFIGNDCIMDTIDALLYHAKEAGYLQYLRTIHKRMIDSELHAKIAANFKIERDYEYDDYILDIHKSLKLEGRDYSGRRKEISSFQDRYKSYIFKKINIHNTTERDHLLELFNTWEEQNSHKVNENETNAFRRILDHHELLGIDAFGIYIDEKFIALIISEHLNKDFVMFHYGKTDKNFRNATTMLMHKLMEYYDKEKYRYINIQQDLGIEGLRTYKRLWRPSFYTEKYLISPKQ